MNCENCKHWIYGYCRLLDCRREKDFLCNAWELSVSYERTAKMTAELEMSLTDKLLESRRSPETLLARIAELEAEVLELKPYRDGYDATKVFPPEGQWVWLRDCDDNIEPVQYDHKAGFYWNYSTNTDGEPFCYWENNNVDIRRWYPMPDLPEEVQE